MAIQMRRGANTDFNASKMLPGEVAVTTDGTKKAYVAFAPNVVKELASKEDVQDLINSFTSVVDKEIAEAEQRIESKGQEVLDTIPDLYEEVSARADEAIRTKADAIICTVSGVAPIAQDSSNDYARNLKLYGKTTQPTTSGKQLCNFPDAENINYEGITWSCKNGVVTAKGTSTALSYTSNTAIVSYLTGQKGTYFISGNVENVKAIVGVRDASGTVTYYTNQSFTLDGTEQLVYIYCQIASGVTVDATLYPMLNEGTTALHWEKYTGNAPSPSPSYPQPLESKGKWGNIWDETTYPLVDGYWINSATGKETVDSANKATIEYIPISKYAGKTLYINKLPTGVNPGIAFYNTDKTFISGVRANSFTVPTNAVYMRFCEDATETDIIISERDLPYRPYTGQLEIESGVYGKNFLVINQAKTTQTVENVIFTTDYEKGIITGNGTATADSWLDISKLTLKAGDYVLSGCYGGSWSTYRINVYSDITGLGYVGGCVNGEELKFNLPQDATITIRIFFNSGAVFNNAVFYPMISLEGGTFEPYKPKQSHISLVTETGLKGIPVTDASLATYTDENGQMWCSDYVDCERGVLVQRILEKVFDGSENILIQTTGYNDETPYFTYVYTTLLNGVDSNALTGYKCNKLIEQTPNHLWMGRMGFAIDKNDNNIRFRPNIDEVTDVTTFKAKLKEWYDNGEPLIISGIRRTPIETPLTASEIESFKALRSNYHVTTVMNDCDAYMDFTYNADTEIWINNKIEAKVASALASLALS